MDLIPGQWSNSCTIQGNPEMVGRYASYSIQELKQNEEKHLANRRQVIFLPT